MDMQTHFLLRSLYVLIIYCTFIATISSQDTLISKKVYQIIRTEFPPTIDGILDDPCWAQAALADKFVQLEPLPFSTPSQVSIVKMTYDNDNLYLAAHLHDVPDQISKSIGARDGHEYVNTDYFSVGFDTYNDDRNGFRFVITPAGIQSDAKLGNFDSGNGNTSNTDFNWDAVWTSSTKVVSDGWTVEIKIPLYNLRFPKKNEQIWGLQFVRFNKQKGELSTWQAIDPKQDGILIQWGDMTGLKQIKPSLRLSFNPYFAANYSRTPLEKSGNQKQQFENQKAISGGLDIKYGINESFTLDATLIPDFSQVQSDRKILNLTPFEIRFEENRPFFTEGVELFNKSNVFYSRRVGGTPFAYHSVQSSLGNYEKIINNPTTTNLYNATKISGRTNNNFGVGLFNAIVAKSYAIIQNTETGTQRKILTNPLTNYNIAVLQKQLKNNSDISLINGSTLREGNFRDANITALNANLKDKKNNYGLSITSKLGNVYEPNEKVKRGFVNSMNFGKISGSKTWYIFNEIISNHYDPSDIGYFSGNNIVNSGIGITYNQYNPNKVFLNSNWWLNGGYSNRYSPWSYAYVYSNIGFWGKFKNQSWANLWIYIQPIKSFDYYEPRVIGKKLQFVPYANSGFSFGTDDRKKLYWNFYIGKNVEARKNYSNYSFSIRPVWRINEKINISLGANYFPVKNERGFITFSPSNDIIIGERSQKTVVNELICGINPNKRSSIRINLRHYVSSVIINKYYNLLDNGQLSLTNYTGQHDYSINFFNLDVFYQWQFRPGSFMTFSWKNNASIYQDILDRNNPNYTATVNQVLKHPKYNELTIKISYFLNYSAIKKSKILSHEQ